MAATDATLIFQAHSVTLKYDLMFYLTQNWFLCMYSGIVFSCCYYVQPEMMRNNVNSDDLDIYIP